MGLVKKSILTAILVAIVAIFVQHPDPAKFPDLGKTIQEIISSRGFRPETHFIQTSDGYILQSVRIINPRVKDRSSLKPILLSHGFQSQGGVWIVAADGKLRSDGKYWEEEVNGKDAEAVGNSLGFVLATRGYDVWLANWRGTVYSRNHTKLRTDDNEFWKFSVDEIIAKDLPAQINYIRSATNHKSIAYIGHSMGNYIMLGLMASQPQYSQVIKPFIALSPVAYFSHSEAVIIYGRPFMKQLLKYSPREFGMAAKRLLHPEKLCTNPLLQGNLCYWLYWFLFGSPRAQLDLNRLPVYMDTVPAGSSMRTYIHLIQQKSQPMLYDYSYEQVNENQRLYNQAYPPVYPFSAINSTDIAFIYTKNDWFNHQIDIHLLKENLKVKLLDEFEVPDPTWNHMELLWARDVGKVVNSKIINLLEKY